MSVWRHPLARNVDNQVDVWKVSGNKMWKGQPITSSYNIGNMQIVRTFVLKLGSVVTTVRKIGEFRFLTPNNLETHNMYI
jgi:hypothetical protein